MTSCRSWNAATDGRWATLITVAPGRRSAQQLVHAPLGRLVERRGRLVEEQPVRAVEQRAREGEALLLAARQHQRPVGGLVEPRREVPQPAGLQHLAAGLVGVVVGRLGIAQRLLAACRSADRASAAGTARAASCGVADAAAAERPQARRARGTAWSCRCPRGRAATHGLALADGDDRRPPAAACRSAAARRRPAGPARASAAGSPRRRVSRRAALGLDHGLAEGGEPVDDGLPGGELRIGVDEPRQRALHLGEGVGRLRQDAELDLAGEILRRGDDDRERSTPPGRRTR